MLSAPCIERRQGRVGVVPGTPRRTNESGQSTAQHTHVLKSSAVLLGMFCTQDMLSYMRDDKQLLGPQDMASTLLEWGQCVQQVNAVSMINQSLASVVQPMFGWSNIQVRAAVYHAMVGHPPRSSFFEAL